MSKKNRKRQNTLKSDEPKIVEWTRQTFKTAQRQINEVIGKQLPPAAEEGSAMTMPPPAGGDTAFRLSGLLGFAIILLILIFGSILGMRIYSVLGMGSNHIKNIPIVYLQGADTLKFAGPLLETPVTVAKGLRFDSRGGYDLDENTAISEDGKQLLYLDNIVKGSGDLYIRNIDRAKPRGKGADSRGKIVATDVLQGFLKFEKDNRSAVYLRREQGGEKVLLHQRDGREEILDSHVHSITGVAENGCLYYTVISSEEEKADSRGTSYSLCRLDTDGTAVVLAQNLSGQMVQLDAATGSVIFSDTQSALLCWDGSAVQKLSDKIGSVADYGGAASVFYTETATVKTNPMQCFEDDRAVTDALMKEPLKDDFMVETKNIWGAKKTVLDEKAFDAATEEYAAKINRENIRETIIAQEKSLKRQTLYYNSGVSKTMVDDNILMVRAADAKLGVAIYTKERVPKPQKVMISQVTDPADAIRLINTVLMTTVSDSYYVSIGHEPEMFLSITESENVNFELDMNKGVYYIKSDENDTNGQLSYVSVQEDGLGVAKKLDDKVMNLMGIRYRDQTLYMREENEGETVALCGASGVNRSRMANGLPIYPMPDKYGDILLCYSDYNDVRRMGTLSIYGNNRMKPIGERVYSYSYRLPNYIYLLSDYDSGFAEGDLYVYSGNSDKLKRVDYNVSDIVQRKHFMDTTE